MGSLGEQTRFFLCQRKVQQIIRALKFAPLSLSFVCKMSQKISPCSVQLLQMNTEKTFSTYFFRQKQKMKLDIKKPKSPLYVRKPFSFLINHIKCVSGPWLTILILGQILFGLCLRDAFSNGAFHNSMRRNGLENSCYPVNLVSILTCILMGKSR